MTTTSNINVTDVNKNFKIKVYGYNNDAQRINTLVGVSGLIALIGQELAEKFINRAFRDSFDESIVVCKLRRGLKVTFYQI